MSYRSFKRVLGETNLERKFLFLFGGCLLILITGSFYLYGGKTERLVHDLNKKEGKLLVDNVITRVHWIEDTKDDKENPHASLFAQELGEGFQTSEYDYRFLYPGEGAGTPKSIEEHELLKMFLDDPEANEPIEMRDNETKKYVYYQPIRATQQTCVDCHTTSSNNRIEKEGDLIAVARISFSDESTQSELSWNRAILISTAIVTVSMAMIMSYLIVRYLIAKPLKHLKDISDSVSHGNLELRANIHTGDEFEELGRAFNRMLRHLVAVQEELRQVNGSLDGKVDELAQANLALYELNRMKSDFLATMSHELRTPLNSILGFSDVLESIDLLNDKQKRYVTNIQKSGRLLLDMINDILDLAKIESGKMEVKLSDFHIHLILSAQCDLSRPLTEKKNIDLEIELEPNLPPLHQDQAKVQQILVNLLSNAIKFTPEGGRITVSAHSSDENDLILVVSDTGVGISEEDQLVIFEKFRQGKSVLVQGNAMTREYSGTGLGLSIVKELCKLLGGEVSLESELGKGSAFTVTIPMVLPEQQKIQPTMAPDYIDLTKAKRVNVERSELNIKGTMATALVSSEASENDTSEEGSISTKPGPKEPESTSS